MGGILVVYLVAYVIYAAELWAIFTKAGQEGWKGIIPIYNIFVLLKIVGRPGWWLILFIIPFVNIIIFVITYIDLAKVFGKGVGFAIGLIFLSLIFLGILGFGSAQYQAPASASA